MAYIEMEPTIMPLEHPKLRSLAEVELERQIYGGHCHGYALPCPGDCDEGKVLCDDCAEAARLEDPEQQRLEELNWSAQYRAGSGGRF